MEACAWGCISAAAQSAAAQCVSGEWRAAVLHDGDYDCVCVDWVLVAEQSGKSGHDDDSAVDAVQCDWGIYECEGVQELWGRGVEAEYCVYADLGPGDCVWDVLLPQPVFVGQGVEWCGAVHDDAGHCGDMVLDQLAAQYCGKLVRIQAAGTSTSSLCNTCILD